VWRKFKGRQLSQIAFPLGGIGTGCVSFSGRGTLIDWELWNRSNKGCTLPHSFFAIRTKIDGERPVARLLAGYPKPPFTSGTGGCEDEWGYNPRRMQGDGLPCMSDCVFEGAFPFARVHLRDPRIPIWATVEAFNPFIPHNPDDSGIPVVILVWTLTNNGKERVVGTLAGSFQNAVGKDKGFGGNINSFVLLPGLRGIFMTSQKFSKKDPAYGSMGIFTTCKEVTFCLEWEKVPEHHGLREFWTNFAKTGLFDNRTKSIPSAEGKTHTGTLGVRFSLEAGKKIKIPIFITWYFPNFEKYWGKRAVWQNYYGKIFRDALDVAKYVAENFERLEYETRIFSDTLQDSTLPECVLDAVSSQMSVLKTPTCLRLPDGTFYGWEGCFNQSGCCEGTCTHVWNYAQALPYLFPTLARSSREAEYRYSFRKDSTIGFRLQLPLGTEPWDFDPAADGQFGSVVNFYRDWLISNEEGYLKGTWPLVKKAFDKAIELWDPEHRGVPEGPQHNTYDIEFVGQNSMIGGMYLGALRTAEEISRLLGDFDSAAKYRTLFERGRD